MATMCYRCMTLSVEGGVCKKCGEPEMTAEGNGPKALPPGTKLNGGRITVGKKLGSGGFGITYIAYDHRINRRIALKEFLPNYMVERKGLAMQPKGGNTEAYEKALNSFRKEARALYELRGHPNIVHVISTFAENNTAYYTMEVLEGESLLSFLRRRNKISAKEAFRLLSPIMDAVRYMHQRKMLHRDISPDNVMLCQDPGSPERVIPKLIDFGAAHVAIEGFSASYPGVKKNGFSPLEQNWAGKYQGPWTDVYSLCATFYGAVIGAVPPPALDRAVQVKAGKDADPLKPARQKGGDISEALDQVLMKGLALQYQDRIQNMDQLLSEMTQAMNADIRESDSNETVIDPPLPVSRTMTRPAGRRLVAWMLDTLLAHGAGTAIVTMELLEQGTLAPAALLERQPLLWAVPLVVFLLQTVLLKAAKGTLGHLITGLKIQRDDTSECAMGFGFCLLYALLEPGLIGLVCEMIFLGSGRKTGPLDNLCQAAIFRRKEVGSGSFGAVMISGAVAKPASAPVRSVVSDRPSQPPAPKPESAAEKPKPPAEPEIVKPESPPVRPAPASHEGAAPQPSSQGRPAQPAQPRPAPVPQGGPAQPASAQGSGQWKPAQPAQMRPTPVPHGGAAQPYASQGQGRPAQPAQPRSVPVPHGAAAQAGPSRGAPVRPAGPVQKPAAQERTAHLLIRKAADALANLNGKTLTLHSGDTLGKNAAQAKIVISDPTISKLHCRFLYQDGRGWLVKDENSTNGTYVNNQRIPAGGMAPLKPGTMIRTGKETMEFKA